MPEELEFEACSLELGLDCPYYCGYQPRSPWAIFDLTTGRGWTFRPEFAEG